MNNRDPVNWFPNGYQPAAKPAHEVPIGPLYRFTGKTTGGSWATITETPTGWTLGREDFSTREEAENWRDYACSLQPHEGSSSQGAH